MFLQQFRWRSNKKNGVWHACIFKFSNIYQKYGKKGMILSVMLLHMKKAQILTSNHSNLYKAL